MGQRPVPSGKHFSALSAELGQAASPRCCSGWTARSCCGSPPGSSGRSRSSCRPGGAGPCLRAVHQSRCTVGIHIRHCHYSSDDPSDDPILSWRAGSVSDRRKPGLASSGANAPGSPWEDAICTYVLKDFSAPALATLAGVSHSPARTAVRYGTKAAPALRLPPALRLRLSASADGSAPACPTCHSTGTRASRKPPQ